VGFIESDGVLITFILFIFTYEVESLHLSS